MYTNEQLTAAPSGEEFSFSLVLMLRDLRKHPIKDRIAGQLFSVRLAA
jgi:hypothetical protein